jgi:putative transferase (TIGR04331 family)
LVKRFLITTALEETWPKDPEIPVLFLGEWCRIYSRRERWSKMNAEVLPYHWDDREKLFNDYQYLSDIYENMLKALHKQLNEFHQVDYSLRYWRILVGPWLGWFIQMVFDRWSMLKCAFEKYQISGCKVLLNGESAYIPNDFKHSDNLWIDDNWNEMIYGQLLDEYWKDHIDLEYVTRKDDQVENTYRDNGLIRSSLNSLKQFLLSVGNKYKYWMNSSDDYFFFKTYLPSAIEDELLLRLGQKPKPWATPHIPIVEASMGMRKWTIEKYNEFDEFSNIIDRMIPLHIPTAYLEGYNSLVNLIENLIWPNNPKCIFASNGIQSLDLLKAWVAQKVENGTRLIIGQHGGHYGIGKWNWIEEHEISISDRYLSWGWSDPDQPKVHPVGQIKNIKPLGINHAEQSKLLLVTNADSRYSYRMFSSTVASQWLDYLEDQFTFTEKLHPRIQNNLTVRLYVHEYGWGQQKRWRDRFPNLAFDLAKNPIHESIARSQLFVSTYNGATYLESFTMNVPTVIFWNPKHWEVRDSVRPYFDDLKKVGIFHETPESAALHVSEVWDDVDGWWKSKSVRKALDQFKSQYCDIDCDLTGNIEAQLRAESIKS